MPAGVRGSHHCVGIATAVTEMVFKHLRQVCEARGGNLGLADIETAQSQVMRSYAGASAFFDATHHRCMEASVASAPSPFGKDHILASMLLACGQKAARPAFTGQIARFGEVWLGQFFDGVAQYVRQQVSPGADERLRQIYASLSGKLGAALVMQDMMRSDEVRRIMQECAAPLVAPGAPDMLAAPLSDIVSQQIATLRGIPKPDLSKVTEQEMKKFLSWLPPQMQLALGATGPIRAAG